MMFSEPLAAPLHTVDGPAKSCTKRMVFQPIQTMGCLPPTVPSGKLT